MAWMKMDAYFRESSSDEKSLLFNIGFLLMVAGLEYLDMNFLYFFSKMLIQRCKKICITLVTCNQINLMEWFSEWKLLLELKYILE